MKDLEVTTDEQDDEAYQDGIKASPTYLVIASATKYYRNALIRKSTGEVHSPWWVAKKEDAYAFENHELATARELAEEIGGKVLTLKGKKS